MRPERRFERRNGRGGCDAATAPKHTDSDPSEVNLLPAKFGLDNGVHFTLKILETARRNSPSLEMKLWRAQNIAVKWRAGTRYWTNLPELLRG